MQGKVPQGRRESGHEWRAGGHTTPHIGARQPGEGLGATWSQSPRGPGGSRRLGGTGPPLQRAGDSSARASRGCSQTDARGRRPCSGPLSSVKAWAAAGLHSCPRFSGGLGLMDRTNGEGSQQGTCAYRGRQAPSIARLCLRGREPG